ncbi:MAG: formate-dependent nitrite reductase membrane component NrfD [Limisphaerales bacterium]|jgi:formate-dependent nitrite reductase membrane component NrfD
MTWGVPVILYFFLAGLAAGAALHGVTRALGEDAASRKTGARSLALATALIVAGAGFLILELERPSDSWMLIFHANHHSAISWGVRILAAFGLCCFFCWSVVRAGARPNRGDRVALRLTQALAVMLASYPGYVLFQAKAFLFWSSWLLVPLLAVGGIHAGLALSRWLAKEEPLERRRELEFIAVTASVFMFFVMDRADYAIPRGAGSTGLIAMIGVLGIGFIAPIVLILGNGSRGLRMICIVAGCLALRAWLIFGGQTIAPAA